MAAPTPATGRRQENVNVVLRGEKFGFGSFTFAAAGLAPAYELFNPTNSGVIVLVDRCTIGQTVLNAVNFWYLTKVTTQLLPITGNGLSFLDLSASKAEVTLTNIAFVLGLTIDTRQTQGIAGAIFDEFDPVPLREGEGVRVILGSNTRTCQGGFQWREVDPVRFKTA